MKPGNVGNIEQLSAAEKEDGGAGEGALGTMEHRERRWQLEKIICRVQFPLRVSGSGELVKNSQLIAKRRDFVVWRGTSTAFAGNIAGATFPERSPVGIRPCLDWWGACIWLLAAEPRGGTPVKKQTPRVGREKTTNQRGRAYMNVPYVPTFPAAGEAAGIFTIDSQESGG